MPTKYLFPMFASNLPLIVIFVSKHGLGPKIFGIMAIVGSVLSLIGLPLSLRRGKDICSNAPGHDRQRYSGNGP